MILPTNCFERGCRHYIGVKQFDKTELSEVVTCAAYPDGIPEEIAYGPDKHYNVRSDQNNLITYEKA